MRSDYKETLFTPILLIVVFGLILAANYLPVDLLGMDENPYLALIVIELLTYSVPSLFYCRIRGREFTPNLRLRLFPPSQILYLLFGTLFLVSGVMLVSMLMYTVSPEAFESSSVTAYAAFAMNDRFFDLAYLILVLAVLPAVTEEFLFRGILVGEYEKKGAGIAVAVSSAAFAMSHFSAVRFPVYLFSGIVLCGILYTTRSVIAAMIAHAVNNTVVLLSEKYVLHVVDKQNVSLVLLTLILGAVTLLVGMLMCYEAQGIYRGYADANVESEYARMDRRSIFPKVAEAFFSPTFLIVVIVFVVAAVAKN